MKTKLLIFSIIAAMLAMPLFLSSCEGEAEDKIEVNFTNLENGKVSVAAGSTYDVKIALTKNDKYYQVEFESSDPEVFVVNEMTGRITGVAEGTGELIVKGVTDPSISSKCSVVVTEGPGVAVSKITVEPDYSSFTIYIPDETELAQYVTVLPAYAANKTVKYSITPTTLATIDENTGKITPIADGKVTITIAATDGSEVSTTCTATITSIRPRKYTNFDRSNWKVLTSHPTPDNLDGGTTVGTPQSLIDDPTSTSCLSLVKPGKSLSGDMKDGTPFTIKVGSTEEVYFIVDMGSPQTFNFFNLWHRKNNTVSLWMWSCDISVSDDNENYTLVKENLPIPHANTTQYELIYEFDKSYTARYLKIRAKSWSSSSSSMQMLNMEIGTFIIL